MQAEGGCGFLLVKLAVEDDDLQSGVTTVGSIVDDSGGGAEALGGDGLLRGFALSFTVSAGDVSLAAILATTVFDVRPTPPLSRGMFRNASMMRCIVDLYMPRSPLLLVIPFDDAGIVVIVQSSH